MTTASAMIPAPHRILVVHEETCYARLLSETFAELGLVVEIAQSRDIVRARSRCDDPETRPALVVLGLMLEHQRGAELLAHLRSCAPLAGIAVIVTSASPGPDDAQRSEMLGADGYLEWPAVAADGSDDLVTRCRQLLALRDEAGDQEADRAELHDVAELV